MNCLRAGLLFTLFVFLVAPGEAHAQAENYQLFRMDSGLGFAMTPASSSYGLSVYGEPKFNLHDHLSIGLRVDVGLMFGGSFGEGDVDVSQQVVSSQLAKVDFYTTTASVRPFVGFGLGHYYLLGQDVSTSSTGASVLQEAGSFFGIAPQIGIMLGGFRIAATYNVILGAETRIRQAVATGGMETVDELSRNYLTITLGGRFMGERREPAPPTEPPPGPAASAPTGAAAP